MTQDEKLVSEKDEKRFHELNGKPEADRTDEEKTELQQLKDSYAKSARDRISELTKELRTAKTGRAELEAELNSLKTEVAELKAKPAEKPLIKEETIKIGDKQFFTDATLRSKVDAGEISESEAYRHQQDRIEEAAAEKAYQRIKGEQTKAEEAKIRIEDRDNLLRDYPHFDPKHPDHNPDDPLYKEANRIYKQGYYANPRGFTEAVKDAKRILRMTDTHIDRSADLGAEEPHIPGQRSARKEQEDKITLSAAEEDAAIRMWTLGDAPLNPKTGRHYTPKEALAKALEAKKERMKR